MARVPVIRVDDILIATIPDGLRDQEALDLQSELGVILEQTGARGVLLDVSVVEVLDSFLGRLMHDIALQSRLLGAETVVAGMQPAVAMTLVELGLDLGWMHAALNASKGLAMLRSLAPVRANSRGRYGR
ncbi:MAG: STAS domain-containing protein [Chloroflexota bacterium]